MEKKSTLAQALTERKTRIRQTEGARGVSPCLPRGKAKVATLSVSASVGYSLILVPMLCTELRKSLCKYC